MKHVKMQRVDSMEHFKLRFRSVGNLLHFKKLSTKDCKTIERISFSKGTAVNVNKDIDTFAYF